MAAAPIGIWTPGAFPEFVAQSLQMRIVAVDARHLVVEPPQAIDLIRRYRLIWWRSGRDLARQILAPFPRTRIVAITASKAATGG
jgi:hypothetical protein